MRSGMQMRMLCNHSRETTEQLLEADVGNLIRCDQDFYNGLLATCKCRCCAGAGKELGMYKQTMQML
jgi:hypothetical protein